MSLEIGGNENNTPPNSATMAASPLPLALPDVSPDTSMISPMTPAMNLQSSMDLTGEIEQDMDYIFGNTPEAAADTASQAERQMQPLTAAEQHQQAIGISNSRGVYPSQAERQMAPSGLIVVHGMDNAERQMDNLEALDKTVGTPNIQTSPRFPNTHNTPRGSQLMSARTAIAQTAMAKAASDTLTHLDSVIAPPEGETVVPWTRTNPSGQFGPYKEATNAQLKRQVEELRSQQGDMQRHISNLTEKCQSTQAQARNYLVEREQAFSKAATQYQQAASDEQQVAIAGLQVQATREIQSKEQTIYRLQERLQGVTSQTNQAFHDQQLQFEKESQIAMQQHESKTKDQMTQLVANAQSELVSEKSAIEQQAMQLIEQHRQEAIQVHQKAEARMQNIHDEATRHCQSKDRELIELQKLNEAIEQSLSNERDANHMLESQVHAQRQMISENSNAVNLSGRLQESQQILSKRYREELDQLNATVQSQQIQIEDLHSRQNSLIREGNTLTQAKQCSDEFAISQQKLAVSAIEKQRESEITIARQQTEIEQLNAKILIQQKLEKQMLQNFDPWQPKQSEITFDISSARRSAKPQTPPPIRKDNKKDKAESSVPTLNLGVITDKREILPPQTGENPDMPELTDPEEEWNGSEGWYWKENWEGEEEEEEQEFTEDEEKAWEEFQKQWETKRTRSAKSSAPPEGSANHPHRKTLPDKTDALIDAIKEKTKDVKEETWVTLPPQPKAGGVPQWRTETKKALGLAAKGHAEAALRWTAVADEICDSDMAEEEAQLALTDSGDFINLDIAFAKALWAIMKGHWVISIKTKSDDLQKINKVLKGRQLYWYIIKELKRSSFVDRQEAIDRFMKLELRNDNLMGYLNAWTKHEEQMAEPPAPEIKLLKFYTEIEKSKRFAEGFSRHMHTVHYEDGVRDFDKLWSMVEKFIVNERRVRNDAGEHAYSSGYAQAGEWKPSKGTDKGKGKKGKGKDKGKEDKKWGRLDTSQQPDQKCPQGQCYKHFWWGSCHDFTANKCSYKHDVTLYPEGKGYKSSKGKGKGKGKGKEDAKGKGKGKGKEDTKGKGKKGKKDKGGDAKPRTPSRGRSPSGVENAMGCSFYMKFGWCRNKNNNTCPFWHPHKCPEWVKGTCPNGDDCTLLHIDNKGAQAAGMAAMKAKEETSAKRATTPSAKPAAKPKAKAKPKKGMIAIHHSPDETESEDEDAFWQVVKTCQEKDDPKVNLLQRAKIEKGYKARLVFTGTRDGDSNNMLAPIPEPDSVWGSTQCVCQLGAELAPGLLAVGTGYHCNRPRVFNIVRQDNIYCGMCGPEYCACSCGPCDPSTSSSSDPSTSETRVPSELTTDPDMPGLTDAPTEPTTDSADSDESPLEIQGKVTH